MSLSEAIAVALDGREVPAAVLEAAFGEIASGEASPVRIAALLIALRSKGETAKEIAAVARALRAVAVTVPSPRPEAVDTCGTGGDGSGTFNISTASAFVVAGAGLPVAKHGNRAASSRAGSADVLEALGAEIDLPVERSAEILSEVGIAFFFARSAHPVMRYVAPVRAELGVRTLMNCLGPLLNPVGVRRQLVGVYAEALVEPLAKALAELGAERALVVHGSDGMDELTTTGSSQAAFCDGGAVRRFVVEPGKLGLPTATSGALRGGDATENAEIVRAVLDGEPGARRDVVVLNAAAALWVGDRVGDIGAGILRAAESIDSGAAREKLAAMLKATQA
ncbi:MAG: anthranilate phosphoribosyltransferase [Myxococcota bacterium]|nr:anthranilate phosphoribosyltransferase [Myxococcota bacterium]